jgi:hypothetical protein
MILIKPQSGDEEVFSTNAEIRKTLSQQLNTVNEFVNKSQFKIELKSLCQDERDDLEQFLIDNRGKAVEYIDYDGQTYAGVFVDEVTIIEKSNNYDFKFTIEVWQ